MNLRRCKWAALPHMASGFLVGIATLCISAFWGLGCDAVIKSTNNGDSSDLFDTSLEDDSDSVSDIGADDNTVSDSEPDTNTDTGIDTGIDNLSGEWSLSMLFDCNDKVLTFPEMRLYTENIHKEVISLLDTVWEAAMTYAKDCYQNCVYDSETYTCKISGECQLDDGGTVAFLDQNDGDYDTDGRLANVIRQLTIVLPEGVTGWTRLYVKYKEDDMATSKDEPTTDFDYTIEIDGVLSNAYPADLKVTAFYSYVCSGDTPCGESGHDYSWLGASWESSNCFVVSHAQEEDYEVTHNALEVDDTTNYRRGRCEGGPYCGYVDEVCLGTLMDYDNWELTGSCPEQ